MSNDVTTNDLKLSHIDAAYSAAPAKSPVTKLTNNPNTSEIKLNISVIVAPIAANVPSKNGANASSNVAANSLITFNPGAQAFINLSKLLFMVFIAYDTVATILFHIRVILFLNVSFVFQR